MPSHQAFAQWSEVLTEFEGAIPYNEKTEAVSKAILNCIKQKEDGNKLSEQTISSCKDVLTVQAKHLLFLTLATGEKNEVLLFHHPSVEGDPILGKNPRLVALNGLNDVAQPLLLEPKILFNWGPYQLPPIDHLKSCDSKEKVLKKWNPRGEEYPISNTIAIPPWLAKPILRLKNFEPTALFLSVLRAARSRDTMENKGEDSDDKEVRIGNEKHVKNCTYILQTLWVWALVANKKSSGAVECAFRPTQRSDIARWAKDTHGKFINRLISMNTNNGGKLAKLNSTLSTLAGFLSATDRQEQEKNRDQDQESKRKGWKRWSERNRKMIHFASSKDGVEAESEPSEALMKLTNQPSAAEAFKHNQDRLDDRKCKAAPAPGVVTAIYHGHFLSREQGLPGNLTIFCFPSSRRNRSSWSSKEMLKLHLSSNKGKGLGDKATLVLCKQKLFFPIIVKEAEHHVNNFCGQLMDILGEDALCTRNIETWISHFHNHEELYDELQSADPAFLTKVLFKIHDRVDRYFRSCRQGKPNKSLINFKPIQNQIADRDFNPSLPPEIRKLLSQKKPILDRERGDLDGGRNKRNKENQQRGSCHQRRGLGIRLSKSVSSHSLACVVFNL